MIREGIRRVSESRWAAVGWTLVIFLLMILPKSEIPNQGLFGIKHLDKLVHAILFGFFVWFWFGYLQKSSGRKGPQLSWRLLALAVAYGTAMEFVQHYFTDRDFDIWDIVADTLGALLVTVVLVRQKISPYGNRGRNQN